MKTAIFCLIMVMLSLGASAQEEQYKNFKKVQGDDEGVLIVDLNIKQALDSLQQEALRKKFDMKGVRKYPNGSLYDWLLGNIWGVCHKEEQSTCDEWEEAIPSTLILRLKEQENQLLVTRGINHYYFRVEAIANNKGQILSVFFYIDVLLQSVIKEEDLQNIYDAVVKKGIDPDKYEFSYPTIQLSDDFIKKVTHPDTTSEGRLALMREFFEQKKAYKCTYGIISIKGLAKGRDW
ncbi:hypothetical protein [Butyricimonas synergistica]|uniref:hypothetical protein n=1 Tax=Butyricimonas synergistica TaxID=544644 RepID=UPI0003A56B82|nr:hypothetical protein [Butyricimonas synergistica]